MGHGLQLSDRAVFFDWWSYEGLTLENVTVLCDGPTAETTQPCSMHAVSTGKSFIELLGAPAAAEEPDNLPMVLVVDADILVPRPASVVQITRNTTITSYGGHNTTFVLDLAYLSEVFNITAGAYVTINVLTLTNLATTYISPRFPFHVYSPLTQRISAFMRAGRQLELIGLVFVVPESELEYMRYWITLILSPVPDYQRQAAWLSINNLQGVEVDDTSITMSMVQITTTYKQCKLAISYPGVPKPHQPITGLSRLLISHHVPLPAVSGVNSEDDFLFALRLNATADRDGWRYLFSSGNFTFGSSVVWPQAPVPLKTNVVLGENTLGQAIVLSMAYRDRLLAVPPERTLKFQGLTLGQLPVRSETSTETTAGIAGIGSGVAAASYSPSDPLGVLSTLMWGIELRAQSSLLLLENCTLLVPRDELQVLQEALVGVKAVSHADPALVEAVRAHFGPITQVSSWDSEHMVLSRTVTQRFSLTAVRLQVPSNSSGLARERLRDLGVPFGQRSDANPAHTIVAEVVGSVTGAVLLSLAAWALIRWWRRRHPSGSDNAKAKAALQADLQQQLSQPRAAENNAAGQGTESGTVLLEAACCTAPSTPAARTNSGEARLHTVHDRPLLPRLLPAIQSGITSGAYSPTAAISPVSVRQGSYSLLTSATSQMAAASVMGMGSEVPSTASVAPATVTPDRTCSAHLMEHHDENLFGSDSFNRPPDEHCHPSGLRPFMLSAKAQLASSEGEQGTTAANPVGSDLLVSDAVNCGSANPSPRGRGHKISADASEGSSSQASADARDAGRKQMHNTISMLGRDLGDQQLTVTSVLGKGASGTVYRGTWRGLQVAIKALLFSSDVDRDKQRALLEAAISSNLAHPNIVITYSYELKPIANVHELRFQSPELAGQAGWRLRLIQEYCDGGTLKEAVDRGALLGASEPCAGSSVDDTDVMLLEARSQPSTEQENATDSGTLVRQLQHGMSSMRKCLEAAIQIASGMAHIHAKNVVHGDLNTSNVLLVRMPPKPGFSYTCKVADFGLSLRMPENQTHVSNLYQGTPYYVAPEVVLTGKMAKSADVYSFGIILWELHNGRRPPWRMQSRLPGYPLLNTGQLEFLPGCPPAYEALARSCFQGGKDQRPSFPEIITKLQEIAAGLDSQPMLSMFHSA